MVKIYFTTATGDDILYRHIPFILLLGIVFFLILSFLSIHVYIFAQISEDMKMRIHAETLFRRVRYHANIDLMDRLLNKKKKSNPKNNLFRKLILSGFRREYKHYKKKRKDILLFDYLQKRIKIQSLSWETQFGMGDAAATGILSGVFWALKGCILSMIQNYFICKKVSIDIKPYFDKKIFNTSID